MKDLYTKYKYTRKPSMAHYVPSALDALRHIRFEEKLESWKKEIGATSFYTDGNNIAHELVENGIKYVFKIEYDDYPFWKDINHQGYSMDDCRYSPEFAEHGECTRYSGDDIKCYLDVSDYRDKNMKLFTLPNEWIKQFYDNKNYSKQVAYENMLTSAKQALNQDIKSYCKSEFFSISITAYNAEGEEITSDSLGGCATDYCTSGLAFYEHNMLNNVREEVKTYFARLQPANEQTNYCYGMAI